MTENHSNMDEPAPAEYPGWFQKALDQPAESCFLEANGNRLHYLDWNPQDSHKPILLFVHGFRGNAHWWDAIAPFFTGHHHVVALDLSGMGDSGHRQQYEAETPAQDILALIEHLGNLPVTAVAHSYGGSRTLRACSDRPEAFKRLIIIDSYILFEGEQPPAEPGQIRGDRVYPAQEDALQRFRLMPEQPLVLDFLFKHVARHSVQLCDGGYRWKFDSSLPPGGVREADGDKLLGSIPCRVDYINGEHSVVVTRERAQRIVNALPDGHGPIVVPDGHHHLMFDHPLSLISVIRALLA